MIEDKLVDGKVTIGKTGINIEAETERGYALHLNFSGIPEMVTVGVSNICRDQRFVLFLDYDNITKESLTDQLDSINEKFGMSHFLILQTGDNRYHCICFEKLVLTEILNVLKDLLVDYLYKEFPVSKLDKGWILRVEPKIDLDGKVIQQMPEYKGVIIYNKNPNNQLSRAHIEFYSKLYPQFKEQLANDVFSERFWDSNTVINVIRYATTDKNFISDFDYDKLINSKSLTIKWIDNNDM